MENTSVGDLQKEINKEGFDTDKEIKIVRVQYFRKKNKLRIILKSIGNFTKEKEDYIKNILKKRFSMVEDFEIICYKDLSNITLEELSKKILGRYSEFSFFFCPYCKGLSFKI